MKIGIPRGLLSSEYLGYLTVYLSALGHEPVLSPETTVDIMCRGAALAPQESCLAFQIYMGQIDTLIGRCDRILVLRQTGIGRYGTHCSRYKATFDLARSIFREEAPRLINMTVDLSASDGLYRAALALGQVLGRRSWICRAASKQAEKAFAEAGRTASSGEEERLEHPGPKVLLAMHPYLENDAFVGKRIQSKLVELGLLPVVTGRLPQQPQRAEDLTPMIPWLQSNRLVGTVLWALDRVDGLVLVSSFPCGPDSMVNDLLCRRLSGLPVLSLSMDVQDEEERLNVRLESFADVILSRKGETSWRVQK